MKYALFLVATVLLPLVQCQRFTQVVNTDKGQVLGRVFETAWHSKPYSSFLGIPFAKPPVDDLRFRDPVEADSWSGVLNATDEAPACVQYFGIRPIGNEDCLYLNVYTPVVDFTNIRKPKPVMVWIYGGAFVLGWSWHQLYGPDYLLEDDVVFVSINYRLGALGFLALGRPDARGNQALKDQNMALQWVQRNIAKFGGDPNKVTIFGESAGSASVIYHLLSPRSKGLFHQAIAQSGSPLSWGYHSPSQSVEIAHEVGRSLGINAVTNEQLLDELKKADAVDIARVSFAMTNFQLPLPITLSFVPTIEEIPSDPSPEQVFLDDCPISKFESGNFTHVPTILGYTKDEGIFFTIVLELARQLVFDKLYALSLEDSTGVIKNWISAADAAAKSLISAAIEAVTTYYFSEPIDITQRYLAKHNGDIPVYYYRLSYSTEQNFHKVYSPRLNGSAHTDDLDLLFFIQLLDYVDPDTPYNRYSQKFVSLWTNFAKFGNPTPNNQPINGAVWKPSGKEGLQLDMGNDGFKMHGRLINKTVDSESSFIEELKLQTECGSGSSSCS